MKIADCLWPRSREPVLRVPAGPQLGLWERFGNGPLPESCRFRLLTGSGRNSADHTPPPNSRAGQSRRRSAPRRPSPRVTLTPAPFVGDRGHRLWRAVLDPLHEGPVELEAGAAFGVQEAADVLRAAVARGNGRRACDRAAEIVQPCPPPRIGVAGPPHLRRPGPASQELTTATASISIMKSGPARRITPTV